MEKKRKKHKNDKPVVKQTQMNCTGLTRDANQLPGYILHDRHNKLLKNK